MLHPELTYFLLDCFSIYPRLCHSRHRVPCETNWMPCVHLVVQPCEADQGFSWCRGPDCHSLSWTELLYFSGSRRRGQREKAVISRRLCKGPAGIVKIQSVVMISVSQVQSPVWFILHINHYLRQTLAASNSCIDVVRVTRSVLVCCGKVSISYDKLVPIMSMLSQSIKLGGHAWLAALLCF